MEITFAEVATTTVAISSALATALPKPEKSRLYALFYHAVTFLACNFGKARNAQDGKPSEQGAR